VCGRSFPERLHFAAWELIIEQRFYPATNRRDSQRAGPLAAPKNTLPFPEGILLVSPSSKETHLNPVLHRSVHSLQRNVLAGLITAGPLFITWLLVSFVLGVLANAGLPMVKFLAFIFPSEFLNEPWIQYVLAVVLTVTLFYAVGRFSSQVVGRQMVVFFEASLERLPLVNKIYTSVRQAVDTLMGKSQTGQRVVLIDFPMAGQKSIGFLTHIIADETTGMPIAAVLVPQAINPTSSYLQFVPLEHVTETNITMEQAMSMLMTGGAVCPDVIRYSRAVPSPVNPDGSSVGVSYALEDESEDADRAGSCAPVPLV
jgi:uncharacterized membrane protein